MTLFHGLSAFPITPADPSGRVDAEALGRLLDRLVAAQVQSVGLLGSTGIYAYLTREERRRSTEAAVARLEGKVPLVAGVGALRTDEAVALAREARQAGADGLLLAPVSYTPLTEDEVFEHCRAVAEEGALPLCLYNNPSTTHFTFTPDLIERLSRLEYIEAVKMPLPADRAIVEELEDLRHRLTDGFAIGYSGDWGCTEALIAGADAWFSVIGGVLPALSMRIVEAVRDGDHAAARKIDAELEPIWALFRHYGSLRVAYAIVQQLGLSDAQPPRPILPLPGEEMPRLREALRVTGECQEADAPEASLVKGESHG